MAESYLYLSFLAETVFRVKYIGPAVAPAISPTRAARMKMWVSCADVNL